jgi:hypothetical protein
MKFILTLSAVLRRQVRGSEGLSQGVILYMIFLYFLPSTPLESKCRAF